MCSCYGDELPFRHPDSFCASPVNWDTLEQLRMTIASSRHVKITYEEDVRGVTPDFEAFVEGELKQDRASPPRWVECH